jgi:nitroreductase
MATARFIALALLGPAVGAMGSSTLPPRGSVLAAARARFACKAFDPARPLPPAALRYLADAALAAPSSFNAQPWRCVLVTSAEAREKLAGGMLAANGKRVREAPLVAVFTSDLRACGRARAVAALTALGGAPAGFVKALPFYVSLFSSGYRLAVLKWPMFWAKQVALWLVSFVQVRRGAGRRAGRGPGRPYRFPHDAGG